MLSVPEIENICLKTTCSTKEILADFQSKDTFTHAYCIPAFLLIVRFVHSNSFSTYVQFHFREFLRHHILEKPICGTPILALLFILIAKTIILIARTVW